MTNATAIKTWKDGEYGVIKTLDEDGDLVYVVRTPEDESVDFSDLESAREWIIYDRNGETLNTIHDLLGDLDLSEKATARKFAAVLAYLKK